MNSVKKQAFLRRRLIRQSKMWTNPSDRRFTLVRVQARVVSPGTNRMALSLELDFPLRKDNSNE